MDFGKEKVQHWIVGLIIKAMNSCSSEQDRLDFISWLTLVREIAGDPRKYVLEKTRSVYAIYDAKKSFGLVFRSVEESVKNYKDSDLQLPLKIALPITLAAAGVIGGQGAGMTALGGAVGVPVLLVTFVGVAGITAIIEAFF